MNIRVDNSTTPDPVESVRGIHYKTIMALMLTLDDIRDEKLLDAEWKIKLTIDRLERENGQ